MPSTPSTNSTFNGGVSVLPLAAEDSNIILTSMTEGTAVEAVATPAPVGSSAGITLSSVVNSGSIPQLITGSVPATVGEVPVSTGVILPSASVLEANMETNNNQFNPFVDEPTVSTPGTIPSTKINVGTPPKSNAKPTK